MKYLKYKYKSTLYDDYLEEIETTDEDMFYIKEKYQQEQKNTLTPEEVQKIFKVAENHKRNLAILKLLYHSWQRIGSIQNLNTEDIDFNGEINSENGNRYHRIHIRGAKNDQSYNIYVEEEAIVAVNNYLQEREQPMSKEEKTSYTGKKTKGYILDNYRRKLYHKDALFLNGQGQRLRSRSMSIMMKQYAAEAGIEKRMFSHLWRATGITISENNGVPISQIMKRSGHTNIVSLKPYLNPKKDETNNRISNALSQKKNVMEPKSEHPQNQFDNSKKQTPNQVTELTIKKLELELLNKKADIELLKLRFPDRPSDTNRSMYG